MSLSNRINRFWRLLIEDDLETLLAEIKEMPTIDEASFQAEEILYVGALALFRSEKPNAAQALLSRVIEMNPRSALANRQLANVLDELEQFDAADRHYSRAHALDPMSSSILVDWGIMLCRSDAHEMAVEKFSDASRMGANNANLLLYWGVAAEGLEDFEKARDLLEQYLERRNDDDYAMSRLGVVYSELGCYKKAKALLRKACDMQPDDPDYLYNLSICLKRDDKLQEAQEIALRLTELTPDSASSWGLLGDIELDLGETDKARSLYSRSLKLNPAESYSLSGLGWAAFQDGDVIEAKRQCAMALSCDQGNTSALQLLREERKEKKRLARYAIEIHGETRSGKRFVKGMDCLAVNDEQAKDFVQEVQALLPDEVWWEIGQMQCQEAVSDERPGVYWISDYDIVDSE